MIELNTKIKYERHISGKQFNSKLKNVLNIRLFY